ncbi:LacI family DNA-binding transcriptional regulator [Paenibacillus sp. MMS18-CY102]|uniref:LacI family DNA-binding transcriptional regulator n=1 Tax=Paenibacillus sp. MMS18-CY102 TaxID=2682849 RepID=UPI0013655146|nr:LacI family DNA-binding transcriptional regulator [Paenibacillus sp. MMS18-CY102]MWC28624.1 LacI family DNA-binding transcriptional regulator [Paenibacillus sp. MMS18-CY102]
MTNISEIAKKAKVSRTTVSRVLNNHPYVKADKRDAVLQVVKEMHYVPNFNAVHLSKGKTNIIGVMVPKIDHPFFSQLIAGIGDACNRYSYSLLLHQSNNDLNQELDFFNKLKYKLVDGLILGSTISPAHVLDDMSGYGKIISCEASESSKIASVFINHESGMQLALDHLREQGHQHIGLCIGNAKSGVGVNRKKSFFQYQQKHQLNWNTDWYFDGKYTIEDGIHVARALFSLPQRPTAIVVGSDYVAAGIIYEAKKQGVPIPESLAVTGFDNQPISEVMELSTIHQPIKELGNTAAELLYNLINNQEIPSTNKLELKLLARKST